MSVELTRYLLWASTVAVGALLAMIDRRWIGWPLLGALLLAGIAAGIVVTRVSPFSFGGGSHYMEGVLVSGASALALVGYLLAAAWQLARRRLRRPNRS